MNDYVYFTVNSDRLFWRAIKSLTRNKLYKMKSDLYGVSPRWAEALIVLSNVDVLVMTRGDVNSIEELI